MTEMVRQATLRKHIYTNEQWRTADKKGLPNVKISTFGNFTLGLETERARENTVMNRLGPEAAGKY
jgi:hypothetical protein